MNTSPAGLSSRALTYSDADSVYRVIAAQELADLGSVEIEAADIVGEWSRPSFDPQVSTVGVFDGERLVGYAEHSWGDRGDAAVHPEYRDRGLGTWLARWMQSTARRAGAAQIGMPVPVGSPGERLLTALGYAKRWDSWLLELPPGAAIPRHPIPPGYVVRAAAAAEYPQVHEVIEDAFLEWSARDRQSYADFAAEVLGRPGFEPWHLRVVADPNGVVVGVANVTLFQGGGGPPAGYVARLAVRRDQRGQGLARALLVDAFGAARAHGCGRCELSTDSRTGALGLYQRVGMVIRGQWVNLAISL